jgi:hypothetical protein
MPSESELYYPFVVVVECNTPNCYRIIPPEAGQWLQDYVNIKGLICLALLSFAVKRGARATLSHIGDPSAIPGGGGEGGGAKVCGGLANTFQLRGPQTFTRTRPGRRSFLAEAFFSQCLRTCSQRTSQWWRSRLLRGPNQWKNELLP